MIERGFWQHLHTGNVWAVEIENERLVSCAGPLDPPRCGSDPPPAPGLHAGGTCASFADDWSSYVPYKLLLGVRRDDASRGGSASAANGPEGRVPLHCSLKPGRMRGEWVGAAVLVEGRWQRGAPCSTPHWFSMRLGPPAGTVWVPPARPRCHRWRVRERLASARRRLRWRRRWEFARRKLVTSEQKSPSLILDSSTPQARMPHHPGVRIPPLPADLAGRCPGHAARRRRAAVAEGAEGGILELGPSTSRPPRPSA